MIPVATTTAWGGGQPLDRTLDAMDHDPSITVVELSIGARPIANPEAVLGDHAFTYLAHHSAPVLVNEHLRPTTHTPASAAAALARLGISRYTLHPPNRRTHPGEDFAWAWDWFETLGAHGIDVRFETMYTPRDKNEVHRVGSYHLATPSEVFAFCAEAQTRGFATPLLIDVSHLYIGHCGGEWGTSDVSDVLSSGLSDHLHISANDGRRDDHGIAPAGHPVLDWTLGSLDDFTYVVDEARRRPRYARGFAYTWHAADSSDC